jgi:hypothetical protein
MGRNFNNTICSSAPPSRLSSPQRYCLKLHGDRKKMQETAAMHYFSHPVGSGKTEALLEYIRDNQRQSSSHFIVPTNVLGRETIGLAHGPFFNHGLSRY